LSALSVAATGVPLRSHANISKPEVMARGQWLMARDTTLGSLECSCPMCMTGSAIGSAHLQIALSDGIVSQEEIDAVCACNMSGIHGARILSAAIIRRRYVFDMPQWVLNIQGDEDLEWVLTHYLFSTRVAYVKAQETCKMYKGARRYKLDGKVVYHSVPCDR